MASTPAKLCAHCRYRPVPPPPARGGQPPRFCSDRCREAHRSARWQAESKVLLNQMRALLGLPAGGGSIGAAELRRVVAVLSSRLEAPLPVRRGRPRVYAAHGTHLRYKQGCRDACCRPAEAAYRRDLRRRRKNR